MAPLRRAFLENRPLEILDSKKLAGLRKALFDERF
jgi:hypothetical protein